DKFFENMMKRYNKIFGHDIFDPLAGTGRFESEGDEDHEPDAEEESESEFEEETKDNNNDKVSRKPKTSSRNFGYEIITGSDIKDPIVRIFGNPDDFPELKGRLDDFLKNSLGSFLDRQGLPCPTEKPGLEPPSIDAGIQGKKEPFSETFKDKDGYTIVNIDVPGIKDSEITVNIDKDNLLVEAKNDKHHYAKTIPIGIKVSEKDIQWYLNNGVLEIKVVKKAP
nr:Hsp20/alpha crystallin family protein [Candidatus Sigynarchaeota archaeon]